MLTIRCSINGLYGIDRILHGIDRTGVVYTFVLDWRVGLRGLWGLPGLELLWHGVRVVIELGPIGRSGRRGTARFYQLVHQLFHDSRNRIRVDPFSLQNVLDGLPAFLVSLGTCRERFDDLIGEILIRGSDVTWSGTGTGVTGSGTGSDVTGSGTGTDVTGSDVTGSGTGTEVFGTDVGGIVLRRFDVNITGTDVTGSVTRTGVTAGVAISPDRQFVYLVLIIGHGRLLPLPAS